MAEQNAPKPELLSMSFDELERLVQNRIEAMIAGGLIPTSVNIEPMRSAPGMQKRAPLLYGRKATPDYIVEPHDQAEVWEDVKRHVLALPPAQRTKYIADLRRAYAQVHDGRLRGSLMAKLSELVRGPSQDGRALQGQQGLARK